MTLRIRLGNSDSKEYKCTEVSHLLYDAKNAVLTFDVLPNYQWSSELRGYNSSTQLYHKVLSNVEVFIVE